MCAGARSKGESYEVLTLINDSSNISINNATEMLGHSLYVTFHPNKN